MPYSTKYCFGVGPVQNNPILTVANVQPCEVNFSFIIEPEGNEWTFEQVYDLYAPPVYAWIQRFVPEAARAEQILMNTFSSAWKNRHEVQQTQVSPLLSLIRISNKDIENCIGKTTFRELLCSFLKRR